MKKSLLGVVLCVALLLSAVSAMLAMPASAAEANLLDGTYSLDQGGDGSATGTLTDGVLTITNTAAGEVGVNLGEGMNLNATPDFVISVDSEVAFNIAFYDANNNKWFNLAADWYPAFGNGSNNEQIAAGSYSDVAVTLTGAYTWDGTLGAHNPDLLPANAAVTGMYICPKAAGNMTITKLAFVGEGGDDTSTTESTETTESTTEATESTTEATTTETEATTTIPADAFIVYTIETVEHEGPIAAGEQVQVKVSTSEATAIAGIGLNIAYDGSVLKAVSAEEQGWFAGLGMSDINIDMENEIRISCMDLAGASSAEGEVIAVLTFEALAEITDGVDLYALASDVVSTDVTATVVGHCTDGGIKVVEPKPTETTTTETETTATETETTASETETTATATETTASETETTKGTESTATTASTTKANESPKTGDASNALLLVVIAAAAAVVLTVSVKKAQAR